MRGGKGEGKKGITGIEIMRKRMRKSIISQKIELVVVYTRSQIWVKVVKERGSHRVFLVMKEEF